jgi:hypothetical protein
MGKPVPGQMCVEAAVNFALGAPHGDQPACVAPTLRALKIRLNDASWSSNEARTNGLRRLALAQLGSDGVLDEKEFVRRVVEHAIKVSVPEALRAAAKLVKGEHKYKLLKAADACEADPSRANAVSAKETAYAAYAAAYAYADSAAAYAAYAAYVADAAAADSAAAAADSAAAADAYAAYAADAYAAYAAASADAAAYAASAAASASAAERVLIDYAEEVVQILIEMKAPGCAWLVTV